MSKRLQVILDDAELNEIRATAKEQRMTVAEWVRQALRTARRSVSEGRADKKIESIRASARQGFPTADIDQMLSEIERGYTNLDSG
ncbi:MAG: antitoxin [Verrucomicrobia bacterium]|nr:antitoxin [Verrucomicrobiota bacterium]MDA1087699.1 antitoxin [Verrucomicrobiota bacterium]